MLDLGAEPLSSAQFGIRLLVPRVPSEGQRRLVYGPVPVPAADSVAASSTSLR